MSGSEDLPLEKESTLNEITDGLIKKTAKIDDLLWDLAESVLAEENQRRRNFMIKEMLVDTVTFVHRMFGGLDDAHRFLIQEMVMAHVAGGYYYYYNEFVKNGKPIVNRAKKLHKRALQQGEDQKHADRWIAYHLAQANESAKGPEKVRDANATLRCYLELITDHHVRWAESLYTMMLGLCLKYNDIGYSDFIEIMESADAERITRDAIAFEGASGLEIIDADGDGKESDTTAEEAE